MFRVDLFKRSKRVKLTAKPEDVSSGLAVFKRKIQELLERADSLDKTMKSLTDLFELKAAARKDVLTVLEDKFGVVRTAEDNLREAQKLWTQIEDKFGANRSAAAIKKEAKALLIKLQQDYDKAKLALDKLADNHYPPPLDEDENVQIENLLDLMVDEFGRIVALKKGKPKWGAFDGFKVAKLANGVRFARFIEVKGIPKTDGSSLSKGFFIVLVDLTNPKAKGGVLDGDFSDVNLAFAPAITDITKITKSFKITSKKATENALAHLCSFNNLAMFNNLIKIDVGTKKDALGDKLTILNSEGVLVKSEGDLINIRIPKAALGLEDAQTDKDIPSVKYQDLFLDVKRLAGISVSAAAPNRIKQTKVKTQPKHIIFQFQLLPVTPKSTDLMEDVDTEDIDMLDKLTQDLSRF